MDTVLLRDYPSHSDLITQNGRGIVCNIAIGKVSLSEPESQPLSEQNGR